MDSGGNTERDNTENVRIFSTEDEKIKSFGELLTNDSSRAILQILMKEEQTASQLAQKTGLSLPLVIYHLNKMQDLDVIKVSSLRPNTRGQGMKCYRATKFAIVILPSSVSEKALNSKSLIRSFKTIYRFAGIAIAGVAAWLGSAAIQSSGTASDGVSGTTNVAPGSESLDEPANVRPAGESESQAFTDVAPDAHSPPLALKGGAELDDAAYDTGMMRDSDVRPDVAPHASDRMDESVESQQIGGTVSVESAPGPPDHAEKSVQADAATAEPDIADSVPSLEGVPDGAIRAAEHASEAAPEGFVIPTVIAAAVVGAGLLLEMAYRMRRRQPSPSESLS